MQKFWENWQKILVLTTFYFCQRVKKRKLERQGFIFLANTFEALIGAIYLDQGYEVAKNFVEKNLIEKKTSRNY